jgi:hypothetical protein
MKTLRLLSMMFAVIAPTLLGVSGFAQTTTGAGSPVTRSGNNAPTVTGRASGFAVQDGVVYFIFNGQANPVTESMLPKNQILTPIGRLAPLVPEEQGFLMEKGVVFYARDGVMQRVDTGMIPGGQMMTLAGTLVPMPVGVTGFPGTQVITVPGRGAPPATSSEIYR